MEAMQILTMFLALFFLLPNAYADVFDDVGREENIDSDLLRAIAKKESWMQPLILNCNGKDYTFKSIGEAIHTFRKFNYICDVGIMQINYHYHGFRLKVPVEQLFDEKTNITIAARILKENMETTVNPWEAVGRYHTWYDKKAPFTGKNFKKKKRSVSYAWKVRKFYLEFKESGA